MEHKEKVKVAIAIFSFAALSIYLTTQFRRRRRASSKSCYLHSELKPQHAFKRVLADNSYAPFKHLSLKESRTGSVSNTHPYEAEIRKLLERPHLDVCFWEGDGNVELGESYVWVETEAQLQELVEKLGNEKVFAVDTEQHSWRSFLGFTALIQISTRIEDYLLDTIALHDVMGILRPVFADPNICKVFHGADNDVLWLQRDFHIYVVHLFDTAKACEVLSKPQRSLAYLLETYCGVVTNKMFQREDWRQRPLSEEMVLYARSDAHFLLRIANSLMAELKMQDSGTNDKNAPILEVLERSNMISLQLYVKDFEASPGESAASSIIFRHKASYNTKFQGTVRRLCAWRDLMARIHDESIKYVLADQAIVALAEKTPNDYETEICSMLLQTEENDVAWTSSIGAPSDVVCSHLEDLYCLLQETDDYSEDFIPEIISTSLGPKGGCPLSVFNYALLTKYKLKQVNRFVSKQSGNKSKRFARRGSSRDQFVQKFSCKSPVYDNCRIYANDGRLLSFCDRRKINWYLDRDLAEPFEDNPNSVRLKFEPKGRPEDEDNDFYIQTKKNICVGCGEENHYLRYRIIPACYRVHFPEHLKSHRSHDIVLLCVDCHEMAHAAAEKYKRRLAAELGIPLYIQKVVDSTQREVMSEVSTSASNEGVSPLQLRTAAMALLRHGTNMPSGRRENLIQIVMKYYGGRAITKEDLEKAVQVGMSPHERRRHEKKKGVVMKNSKTEAPTNKGFNQCGTSAVIRYTDQLDDKIKSCPSEGEASNKQGDTRSSMSADADQRILPNGECSKSDKIKSLHVVDDLTSQASNRSSDFSYPTSDGKVSPKHNSRFSLLGHGPHGRQVVDHLLKQYGEAGINLFCQQWRKVFVEAVHPRFLAAGWDVKHSGRREFGEFSVYNPRRRLAETETPRG